MTCGGGVQGVQLSIMDRVRRIPFIAALLLAVILTGCGGEEPVTHESQAITIDSEGTVLCEFVEDFSEDYYDVEELKNMVSAEIAGFNSDRLRDDAAELVETEKKDGSVALTVAKPYLKKDVEIVYQVFPMVKGFAENSTEAWESNKQEIH